MFHSFRKVFFGEPCVASGLTSHIALLRGQPQCPLLHRCQRRGVWFARGVGSKTMKPQKRKTHEVVFWGCRPGARCSRFLLVFALFLGFLMFPTLNPWPLPVFWGRRWSIMFRASRQSSRCRGAVVDEQPRFVGSVEGVWGDQSRQMVLRILESPIGFEGFYWKDHKFLRGILNNKTGVPALVGEINDPMRVEMVEYIWPVLLFGVFYQKCQLPYVHGTSDGSSWPLGMILSQGFWPFLQEVRGSKFHTNSIPAPSNKCFRCGFYVFKSLQKAPLVGWSRYNTDLDLATFGCQPSWLSGAHRYDRYVLLVKAWGDGVAVDPPIPLGLSR